MPHLLETDDRRHQVEGPLGRESLAFVIPLPDEELGVIAYTYVDHAGNAARAFIVWGADGPIATEAAGPVPAGDMDFDDWTVEGLGVRHEEPLESFGLTYESERFGLDLGFRGRHPAYAYGEHPHGCPQWLASDRFEQHGNLTGRLRVDDREVSLDGRVCFRDHSWGVRDWHGAQHWKWIHLTAGEASVHVMELIHGGLRTLPGFVYRDGELSAVRSLEVDHVDLDDDHFHRSLSGRIGDEAGRVTEFTAESVAFTVFPAHDDVRLHEATVRCELDGTAGDGHVEMLWSTSYVEHHTQR